MDLLSTGIEGLEAILHGGMTAGGVYSIEGDTGGGKTTLCQQFLIDGVQRGEAALYVTLSESAGELRSMAQ
jgi:circadian clock protein KaiC